MLAQGGRRVGRGVRAAGQLDGGVDGAERASVGIAAVHEHIAGRQVFALVQIGGVLYDAHRKAAVQQVLVELPLGDALGPFLDGRDDVAEVEGAGDAAPQVAGGRRPVRGVR